MTEFAQWVRDEPSQSFSSSDELLTHIEDLIFKRINPRMDQVLPKSLISNATTMVNIVPYTNGLASYNSGSMDGSRPGSFNLNLEGFADFRKFELLSLTLHEANPGHNFNAAFMSGTDVPNFLKYAPYRRLSSIPSNFPIYTAYEEGWGLYAESLGYDMGLYR